jgi:hypothetical protein
MGATGESALHGLDVDLDDDGELLERQPRARDRGPEVPILETLSRPQSGGFPEGEYGSLKSSQDVLEPDVPRCPCAVPVEPA